MTGRNRGRDMCGVQMVVMRRRVSTGTRHVPILSNHPTCSLLSNITPAREKSIIRYKYFIQLLPRTSQWSRNTGGRRWLAGGRRQGQVVGSEVVTRMLHLITINTSFIVNHYLLLYSDTGQYTTEETTVISPTWSGNVKFPYFWWKYYLQRTPGYG